MCYWFPRAQQRLTLLTFESGPEIAGYSFLLLLLLLLLWTVTLSGTLYTVFSPNIRIHWERIHWGSPSNIRIHWERIHLGSPSIPLLNCAIDSQGTTDCTHCTAHLLYPFHILLFWVSGLLLHNLRIQTRSLGGHLSPNALLSQYASNLGIYTQLSAHIWHTHAIKRTCLYNQ